MKENKKVETTVNKKQVAGLINVSFAEKQAFCNEKKKTVAVETLAYVMPKVDRLKHIDICNGEIIRTVGIAKCSEEDSFNEKRGYLIASSRSENEAYNEAIKTLKEIQAEAETLANAAKYRIEILKDCIEHNKQFINDVANGN